MPSDGSEQSTIPPDRYFRVWLNDLVKGTQDVLENAQNMGLKDWQEKALSAELALYKNMAELVDTGSVGPHNSIRPVDPRIIGQVRDALDRWSDGLVSLPASANAEQRSKATNTAKAIERIRTYLAAYPVAEPEPRS